LDEAALRRFTRRIFMPLPDAVARESMLKHKMKEVKYEFTDEDWTNLNM